MEKTKDKQLLEDLKKLEGKQGQRQKINEYKSIEVGDNITYSADLIQ